MPSKLPKEKPPRRTPSKRFKVSLGYLLAGLAAILLFNLFHSPPPANEISYSQFKGKIKSGAYEKVWLTERFIHGELRGDKKETEPESDTTKRKGFSGLFSSTPRESAVRPNDEGLFALLDQSGIEYSVKTESTALRDLMSWILPILLIILFWTFILRRMGPGAEVMTFGKNRARVQAESDTKTTFEDVAGQDEAKAELQEIVEFLRSPKRFTHLGGKLPKGIMLLGPPGTGKTLLARAVAGEADVPFFNISGSDFVEMFVGVGAARVRDLFKQAKSQAPCIIFIDELDAVGKARGVSAMGGHDEREQTLNQLLVEIDGFDSQAGVIIMAATNRPEMLDPALLRAGRFDRQVLVGKPDLKEREAIIKLHGSHVKLAPDVHFETLAQRTPGLVGADLANVVNEAALLAARRNKKHVEMADFDEAIERTLAGLEKRKRVINRREKEIVAHHEAGHAVISALTNSTDKVHKISIIPRGIGALGYTLQLPTEDRYLMTKDELIQKVDVLLGGRAAEKVSFGEVSTGAQDDLQKATEIVRAMVTRYGMGKTLGPATLAADRTPLFVDHGEVSTGKNFSEETARRVDEEIQQVLRDRLDIVVRRLKEHRPLLKEVAEKLLEKEALEEKEFQEIVRRYKEDPSRTMA